MTSNFDLHRAIRQDEQLAEAVRNPQPGMKVWRGETRSADVSMGLPKRTARSTPSAQEYRLSEHLSRSQFAPVSGSISTVGQHWSARQQTGYEFANTRTQNEPGSPWMAHNVIWHGRIDDPEFQVEHGEEQGYGAHHWERELKLKHGAPIRVTGASVHIPDTTSYTEAGPVTSQSRWQHFQFGSARYPAVSQLRGSLGSRDPEAIDTYEEGLNRLQVPESHPVRERLADVRRWQR